VVICPSSGYFKLGTWTLGVYAIGQANYTLEIETIDLEEQTSSAKVFTKHYSSALLMSNIRIRIALQSRVSCVWPKTHPQLRTSLDRHSNTPRLSTLMTVTMIAKNCIFGQSWFRKATALSIVWQTYVVFDMICYVVSKGSDILTLRDSHRGTWHIRQHPRSSLLNIFSVHQHHISYKFGSNSLFDCSRNCYLTDLHSLGFRHVCFYLQREKERFSEFVSFIVVKLHGTIQVWFQLCFLLHTCWHSAPKVWW